MECLGIVPARGGSKSIPRKNLVPLCGRPLIEYTFEEARKSRSLDRIVLSSDDAEIISVARKNTIEVPFVRPPELAQDKTPTLPVLQHVVQYLQDREDYHPDIIVLLQPTSPLRKSQHIDEAVNILTSQQADSVVSIIEVPHHLNPVSMMQIADGRLKPFLAMEQPILRRQDKPRVYARNGPAVLAMTYETLMVKDSLYGEDCRPLMMSVEDSVDIDTLFDIELAEWMLERRRENGA